MAPTPDDVLEALHARLLAQPPAGLTPADVHAHLRRHRRALLRQIRQALRPTPHFERFNPHAAPRPGERGHRPPPRAPDLAWDGHTPAALAQALLTRAVELWEEPDLAPAWAELLGQDLLGEEDDLLGEEDELAWSTEDLADLVGLPYRGPDGQPLSAEDRLDLLSAVARVAADTRGAGSGLPRPPRYSSDTAELPMWLAQAYLEDLLQPDRALRLVPLDKATACAFIRAHHRQLPDCNLRGMLYAIGARAGDRLVAVATAGHPTGRWQRRIDPRRILELTRVASDGTVLGAASKLTARCIDLVDRSARGGEGPTLFVTYQLATEDGTPYRALKEKGLRPVAFVPGRGAGGARSGGALAEQDKIRWEAGEGAGEADWGLVGGGGGARDRTPYPA